MRHTSLEVHQRLPEPPPTLPGQTRDLARSHEAAIGRRS